MQSSTEPFCQIPDKHLHAVRFCLKCACDNSKYRRIFYCAICKPKEHQQHHTRHMKSYKLESKEFQIRFDFFYNFLKNHSQFHEQEFIKQICSLPLNSLDYRLFQKKQFLKFICQVRFWSLFEPQQKQKAKIEMKQKILQIMEKENKFQGHDSVRKSSSKVKINWGDQPDQNKQNILSQLIKASEEEQKQLQLRKDVLQLLLKVYSNYQEKEKHDLIKQLNRYEQLSEKDVNILIAKIYLMDLSQESMEKWEPVVKKILSINPKFKNSAAYKYFDASRYWKIVENPGQSLINKQFIFISPRNNKYYKLTDPDKYVKLLSEAIINMKKDNGLLFSARGLGYLCQKKFHQASKDFIKAMTIAHESSQIGEQIYSNIAFSDIYLQNKQKSQGFRKGLIENIQNKIQQSSKFSLSHTFLINIINYFKIQKEYNLIVLGTKKINDEENGQQNLYASVQRVKGLLKINEISEALSIKDKIKDKISDKELKKIQRQTLYANGRKNNKQQNYDKSIQHYKEVQKNKKTASVYFNLASVCYNQQKWQESETYIQQALKLKKNDKYLKLRFHLFLMKKQFDKAKQMVNNLPEGSVNSEIMDILSKY